MASATAAGSPSRRRVLAAHLALQLRELAHHLRDQIALRKQAGTLRVRHRLAGPAIVRAAASVSSGLPIVRAAASVSSGLPIVRAAVSVSPDPPIACATRPGQCRHPLRLGAKRAELALEDDVTELFQA